jgi:hypothetical protein
MPETIRLKRSSSFEGTGRGGKIESKARQMRTHPRRNDLRLRSRPSMREKPKRKRESRGSRRVKRRIPSGAQIEELRRLAVR